MPETAARKLIRRAVGALAGVGAPEVHPGVGAVLDGASAAARVDGACGVVVAEGATGPGRLAAGLGLAGAGERTTVELRDQELDAAAGLLAEAAHRRLPLVVHWRSGAAGHAPLARVLGSGAVVLSAADAQEAADLTLVARRVAEEGLIPVVVAQDGEETAQSLQDVVLPEPARAARWVGAAGDLVHPPTRAQELLFGRHRRRVVRWHDPERPMAQGVALDGGIEALAAAGARAYLDGALPGLLDRALDDLARETGRRHDAVSFRGVAGARLVLVAIGSAIGTAEVVAEALGAEGVAVGVLGLRSLAPFPAERVAELLRAAPAVAVLERLDAPLADGGPVAREVCAAIAVGQDAVRGGRQLAGSRSLTAEVRTALAGTETAAGGGRPPRRTPGVVGPPVASVLVPGTLRGTDLAALCRELLSAWRSPVHLGVAFDGGERFRRRYPKREVLQDALAAACPEAAGLGVREHGTAADLRPRGTLSLALYPEAAGTPDAAEAAALLYGTVGGRVRTRSGRVLWAPGDGRRLAEPGPDAPIDVAVWTGPATPGPELATGLAPGACVLVPSAHGVATGDPADWWTALPAALRDAVSARGVELYTVELASEDRKEALLGALLGLLRMTGRVDFKPRKLLESRRERLAAAGVAAEEVDRRLAALQAGLDRVRALAAAELAVRRTPPPEADPVPQAVREVAAAAETIDSLPRFWDQVGVLEARGERSLLTPDPFLATRTLPALSGALYDASPARSMLPAFDPAACTGCGACWTSCPHGAVVPVTAEPAALLDHGMAAARRKGNATDPLRMAVGKVAAALGAELAASGGGTAGPLLDAAFEQAAAKLTLPPERKAAVVEAFAAVRAELAELPLAHAEPFGAAPLLLALDPDRCTGCGICVAACEPGALAAATDSPARTRGARRLARTLEQLPEPSAAALEGVRSHPAAGPLAAALLARSARRVAGAGDHAEPGSGEALAVRQALGAAAYHLEPLRRRRDAALEALAEELAAAIHGGLATALPDRDLDALANGLAVLERPAADLAELTGRIQSALSEEREPGRVDVARLRRLVEAAREIADLRLHLAGAAPFGLVLAGTPAAWGAAFPRNAFAVPVTVAPLQAGASVARGLAEGACRQAVSAARRVRAARAMLAAVTPSEAARAEEQVRDLGGLAWSDLDADERAYAPPVVLVAAEESLDLTSLLEVLSADLPVKVLALRADGAPSGPGDLLLAWATAAGLPRVVLGQATVADGERLEAFVAAAFTTGDAEAPAASGPAFAPAFLRVLAPVPSTGGFAPDATLERARQAVSDRSFPLFLRVPGESGAPRLDLSGNPPPQEGVAEPAAWAALVRAAGAEDAVAAAAAVESARREHETSELRHQGELESLRIGYESRIHELETGARLALAREVRARLLALATRGPGPAAPALGGGEPAAHADPELAPEGN